MAPMLTAAYDCTRISYTSATRILLRPIDHLRLRCGHCRGHLLRTGRWQIVMNSWLVNSDAQNRAHPANYGEQRHQEPTTPLQALTLGALMSRSRTTRSVLEGSPKPRELERVIPSGQLARVCHRVNPRDPR